MLKIKDDVDLKELKRFGFNKKESNNYYEYSEGNGFKYFVFINNRKIRTGIDKYSDTNNLYDKIFELINANLVEKV